MFPKVGKKVKTKGAIPEMKIMKNYKDKSDLLLGRRDYFKKNTGVIHLFGLRTKIDIHVSYVQYHASKKLSNNSGAYSRIKEREK